ncbi:WG repeat-containing protein [Hyunsoonleella pacifica]|uniref:WG repeat-containing protein n=1 Tax=Hyunsoonleella pacifica TaxID=1080224 RepID=A0A4Q9FJW9_9FLAO|nr:WG repeat-containing protein [Hyunsoonleella pacifica]TBN13937.1 hypothetical protein EYD46_15730 [Hyunsoonleella pacifica]GGD26954.1 hypothetical protein GCM10011368_31220 [Hyunsoonleella pacifica]
MKALLTIFIILTYCNTYCQDIIELYQIETENKIDYGKIVKRKNKYGTVNKKNETLIPFIYDTIYKTTKDTLYVAKKGKLGYINYQNKVLVPFKYDEVIVSAYSRHFGYDKTLTNKGYGIFDHRRMKEVIENKYDSLHTPSYHLNFKSYINEKVGLITDEGTILADNKYEDVLFHNNYLYTSAKKNGLWGVVKNQVVLIPFKYEKIKPSFFIRDLFIVFDKSDNCGLKSVSDKKINISCNYQHLFPFKHGSLVRAKQNGKFGLLDYNEKKILPFLYDDIKQIQKRGYPQIIVEKENKFAILNVKGEFLTDIIYDSIDYETNGFYLTQKDSDYGLINSKGEKILNTEFSNLYVSKFNIVAEKDSRFAIFDLNGKKITDYIFDDFYNAKIYEGFKRFYGFRKNNKYGLLDIKTCKPTTKFIYDSITHRRPRFSHSKIYGYIDGKEVLIGKDSYYDKE